jgi:hypothetical protein
MSAEDAARGKMKRWLILAVCLMLFIGAPIGIVRWLFFSTHRYDPGGPSTPADVAYYTSVQAPTEIRDIHVAAFDYGQARLVFVRFSAPADVCMKYAALVMPNTALKPLSWDQRYSDVMALYLGTCQINHDMRWFDLPYAQGFWSIQSGQPVFRNPSAQSTTPVSPDKEIPQSPDIVGADANTQLQGYLTTSVRVDVSRGVFYFLREN